MTTKVSPEMMSGNRWPMGFQKKALASNDRIYIVSNWPAALSVDLKINGIYVATQSGTCSVTFTKNGSDIAGLAAAANSTGNTATPTSETLIQAGDTIYCYVTSLSSPVNLHGWLDVTAQTE